jgi:hypothetical protein
MIKHLINSELESVPKEAGVHWFEIFPSYLCGGTEKKHE